jgi:hypothetical protein
VIDSHERAVLGSDARWSVTPPSRPQSRCAQSASAIPEASCKPPEGFTTSRPPGLSPATINAKDGCAGDRLNAPTKYDAVYHCLQVNRRKHFCRPTALDKHTRLGGEAIRRLTRMTSFEAASINMYL